MGSLTLVIGEAPMYAPGPSSTARDVERAHLARAHHEICTALTVFSSNVELVRIELRDAPLPTNVVPVHAHLDELEGAVDRLRDIAREMKRWHDDISRSPSAEGNPHENGGRAGEARGASVAVRP